MADIVVVGGGITGLACACLLARADNCVTVLDGNAVADQLPTGAAQLRVLALSRASLQILERCGAAAHWDATRIQPWDAMCVWENDAAAIEFLASDINAASLGAIVEHQNVHAALMRAARDVGVTFCEDTLTELAESEAHISVRTQAGSTLTASLVIGADGAASRVRDEAGLVWLPVGMEESAVVCEVAIEKPFTPTAWQRFAQAGPVALLPLFNGHYSLVWSRADATQIAEQNASVLEAELTEQFADHLGAIAVCSARVAFPLARGRADDWCTEHVALAGDAAHVVHPLAGLGQNLGLMDAAVLVEEWELHPNTARALRTYARRRAGPSQATQFVLEGFRTGFGTDSAPIAALRQAALGAAGRSRTVRQCFLGLADPGVDAPVWLNARPDKTSARR